MTCRYSRLRKYSLVKLPAWLSACPSICHYSRANARMGNRTSICSLMPLLFHSYHQLLPGFNPPQPFNGRAVFAPSQSPIEHFRKLNEMSYSTLNYLGYRHILLCLFMFGHLKTIDTGGCCMLKPKRKLINKYWIYIEFNLAFSI